MTRLAKLIFLLGMLVCSFPAAAHKQSDSYLTITQPDAGNELLLQWDIALRDLEHAIGVDVDGDAAITWGELRQRQSAVVGLAQSHLQLTVANRECPLAFTGLLVDEHVDGNYAVLRFTASCSTRPAQLDVHYSLLFDLDPNHHGLLNFRSPAGAQAVVFSASSGRQSINLNDGRGGAGFASFVTSGIWHIWQGFDHILFLLTLLLPATVLYRQGRWEARNSFRESAIDVVKVVTGFTLAHSITLTLGAFEVVHAPTRLVESAIALTVLFGALNVLYPVVRERRWLLAFVFGLIHGLAFASVLVDLGLHGRDMGAALFGFNAGVELGQLAIVAVAIPLMYVSSHTVAYRRIVMPAGAIGVACLAVYWFMTRAFV